MDNKLIKPTAYYQFLIILIFLCFSFVNAEEKKLKNSVCFQIGAPFSSQNDIFLKDYNNIIGGNKAQYKLSPLFIFSLKTQLQPGFRISLSLDFLKGFFIDNYTQQAGPYTRTSQQNFSINTLPIILSYELIPAETPYRSYFGFGAGVDVGSIIWMEDFSSDNVNDVRKGGTHFDNNVIAPAFKIYTGIELNFDKRDPEELLGAFHIEAEAVFIYRRAEVFSEIADEFKVHPVYWNKPVLILPYYIGISTGLSLNFFQKIKL